MNPKNTPLNTPFGARGYAAPDPILRERQHKELTTMLNIQIHETANAHFSLSAAGTLDDNGAHELQVIVHVLQQKAAAAITVDLHTVHGASAESIDTLSVLRREGIGLSRVPAFIADWLDAEKWMRGRQLAWA